MSERPVPAAVLAAALLAPGAAWAHGAVPGAAGFGVGLLHPLTAPAPVLALVALGLVLGQGRPAGLARAWGAFALGDGLGLVLAWALAADHPPTQIPAQVPLALVALAAGLAVAPRRGPLPGAAVAALAAAAGGLAGLATAPDPGGPAVAAWITLAGAFAGANLALFYLAAGTGWLRRRLPRPAAAVGLRVAGSWVAAIAVLVVALAAAA
ncbi:MAG: hypothetical protein H6907_06635 [Hyphomicrobiales bacterium]|nr:hypothetical protein [Hyphomicrobiales bacterium]